MKKSVVALMCLVNLASCAESYNIETYRVFGPEHPGQYKHPASMTQLSNGDLYIAYYGGSGEYGDDTAVYGSRTMVPSSKLSMNESDQVLAPSWEIFPLTRALDQVSP